jgi:hypothetical protein
MEMTLLTVVYAGQQTAFAHRGRVPASISLPQTTHDVRFSSQQALQKDNTGCAWQVPSLFPARYYLERQISASPAVPPLHAVLA